MSLETGRHSLGTACLLELPGELLNGSDTRVSLGPADSESGALGPREWYFIQISSYSNEHKDQKPWTYIFLEFLLVLNTNAKVF